MQCLLLLVSDLSALFRFGKKKEEEICFFCYLIQPFAHNIVTAAAPLRLGFRLFI